MVPQQLRDVGELEPGRVESLDLGTYHTPLTTLIATIYRVETSELKRTRSTVSGAPLRVSTTVARGAYGSLAKLAARRGLGEFADLSGSGTRPSCRTFHNPDMVMHIQCTIQPQGNSEEHSGLCNCLVPLCFN
jgi:hypothetical protein